MYLSYSIIEIHIQPSPISTLLNHSIRPISAQDDRQSRDEANLLYVAVTRAKKRLILTPALLTLLDAAGVSGQYTVFVQFDSFTCKGLKSVVYPLFCIWWNFQILLAGGSKHPFPGRDRRNTP